MKSERGSKLPMKKVQLKIAWVLVFILMATTPTGCAEAISAVGAGIAVGVELITTNPVTKTVCYEFDRIKRAVLVALCRMEIPVEEAREIEYGEEILARAERLEVKIELKRVTSRVTSIKVEAGQGLMKQDRATAQEIVSQTDEIAAKLPT